MRQLSVVSYQLSGEKEKRNGERQVGATHLTGECILRLPSWPRDTRLDTMCFCSSFLVPFFLCGCFLLSCWTEGAAGRRRMPHKQTSEAGWFCSRPPHEGSSVRTHSAFNRRREGAPLHRSSPCRPGLSVLVLRLVPSPIIGRPSNAPTAPPVQHNACH